MIEIDWYYSEAAEEWDAAEVETASGTLCPYVASLPGPDRRAIFSIDIAAGGVIRSIAVGFTHDLATAKVAAATALHKIDTGPMLV